MDIDEARMQLDATGFAFLIFQRTDTNEVNVIYKTTSGDYVVLESEK